METQSVSKTELSAKRSRNFGILSLGTLIMPFLLLLLLLISDEGGEGLVFLLIGCSGVSFLMGFINGLIGCIGAIVALVKIKKEGGDSRLQRVATMGLVLNGLGILLSPPLLYFLLHDFP